MKLLVINPEAASPFQRSNMRQLTFRIGAGASKQLKRRDASFILASVNVTVVGYAPPSVQSYCRLGHASRGWIASAATVKGRLVRSNTVILRTRNNLF